ncbi:MAG: hypothetical protein EA363_07690 [Balneolaceae bacterium]|nr:MAG: hypothetical protein EA363_07690 [Balneolaceae bacterium]
MSKKPKKQHMNKRFALWGGLVLAMAVVAFAMVQFASEDPSAPQPDLAAVNSDARTAVNSANSGSADILAPRENDWKKGNPDAGVVVVKYSDFQCPACRFYASMDDQLSQELAEDALFIYRHFPLRNFQHSRLAARYSEAAGRQGEFWKMHDLIYINQQRWSRGDAESIFRVFAESLELDMEQLDRDLEDPELMERIESDYRDGQRLGVRAVPTIFINGEHAQGVNSLEAYRNLILSKK